MSEHELFHSRNLNCVESLGDAHRQGRSVYYFVSPFSSLKTESMINPSVSPTNKVYILMILRIKIRASALDHDDVAQREVHVAPKGQNLEGC